MDLNKLLGLASLGNDASVFTDAGTMPTSDFLMGGNEQPQSSGDDSILQMILGMSQRGPSGAEVEDPFWTTESVNKGWTPMSGYGEANPTYGMVPVEEPSIWDRLSGYADTADKALATPLGKFGAGGLGALIAAYGANKQNKLNKQSIQDALAARLAEKAQHASDTAPMRFTNQRTALPSWGAGQRRAFGGNSLAAMTPRSTNTMYAAEGGEVSGQGGLCMACGGREHYVAGGTAGQADKVPAMLSDGEYVMDADSVSALGDGNNAAGASVLDQMRQNIRKHKRAAPVNKIPPKAKAPEAYLKGAK